MIEFMNEVYELEYSGVRRLLHGEIDSVFWEVYSDAEDTEELEAELAEAHDLISAQDAVGLNKHMIGYGEFPRFTQVTDNNLLKEALTSAGYKFESSNASRSIYVTNDNGQEVRIADHKRPAYQPDGQVGFTDHEYNNELIIDGNKVTQSQLNKFGINLPNNEYFLG